MNKCFLFSLFIVGLLAASCSDQRTQQQQIIKKAAPTSTAKTGGATRRLFFPATALPAVGFGTSAEHFGADTKQKFY